MDKIIEDIIAIRNLKATNQITKDAKVLIEVDPSYENFYTSQLKIKDEDRVSSKGEGTSANYKSSFVDITYYYQGKEVDKEALNKEIEQLKTSIQRRENLLANENYVNKAPQNIVELDRKKLQEEKEHLALLEQQL